MTTSLFWKYKNAVLNILDLAQAGVIPMKEAEEIADYLAKKYFAFYQNN